MSGLEFLYKRYRTILGYSGIIFIGVGISLLLPLLLIPIYPYKLNEIKAFLLSSFISIVLGIILKRNLKKGNDNSLSMQEGGIIVLVSWVGAVFLSALPFVFSGDLNLVQAVFETTSGYTTTGLSVVDVANASHMVLLWRSIMQFLGGVGLIVIMLSMIIGPDGLGLYNAEGRSDKLVPHIRKTTSMIMIIYISYIVAGVLLYVIAGMPLFDSINHSIAAVSTGGFSTKVESIGYYDSVAIELITIILMLLGTINFAAHAILWKGKVKEFIQIGEFKMLMFCLAFSTPIVLYFTTLDMFTDFSKSLRVAIFEIVSAISTTGFSTVPYFDWNDLGVFMLTFVMLIGGGTGSTAGGIKQYRVYVLLKTLWWDIKGFLLPKNAVKQHYINRPEGRYYINDKHRSEVSTILVIYLLMFVISIIILMGYGYGLRESMFEIASCLSTVGLSIGITSPDAKSGVLITETIMMFLGRLEFLVVFYSLMKLYRDFKFILSKRKENI